MPVTFMSRVFAISDLHVDYPENMQRMLSLSDRDYVEDTLIIAGDVTDSLDKLALLLNGMLKKFNQVTFIPGNHELWVRDDQHHNSIEKLRAIRELCDTLGVHTERLKVTAGQECVWLVPLYSWYRYPEEGAESLFIAKQGEKWKPVLWLDTSFCKWHDALGQHQSAADYFLSLNSTALHAEYDAPIISFSHFLPRKELVFKTVDQALQFSHDAALIPAYPKDPLPLFNFTRVAGCRGIDSQIRRLGASVHIYGHQHRNRCRHIDGVTYVSNCVGYAREQSVLGASAEPRLVWDNGHMIEPEDSI